MSQITAIEPQKKRQDRFNIFLDGHFGFALEQTIILKNNLKPGLNLDEFQIQSLIKEDQSGKLLDLALKFLSSRPHSEKEIKDYLAKKISQKENIKFNEAKESQSIN